MRLVKIPRISYHAFEAIRGVILNYMSWAMYSETYEAKTETAYFRFWDGDYIPDILRPFVVSPPGDYLELVHSEIETILTDFVIKESGLSHVGDLLKDRMKKESDT